MVFCLLKTKLSLRGSLTLINFVNHSIFEVFASWSCVLGHVWNGFFHWKDTCEVLFVVSFNVETVHFFGLSAQWRAGVLFPKSHVNILIFECRWSFHCLDVSFLEQVIGEWYFWLFDLHLLLLGFWQKLVIYSLLSSNSEFRSFFKHFFE